jgi:hypothetical protein
LDVADEVVHMLLDLVNQALPVGRAALDNQFHASIMQIAHISNDVVALGNVHGSVPKPNALHIAAEETC